MACGMRSRRQGSSCHVCVPRRAQELEGRQIPGYSECHWVSNRPCLLSAPQTLPTPLAREGCKNSHHQQDERATVDVRSVN